MMKKLFLTLLFFISLSCLFALDGTVTDVKGKVEKQNSDGEWVPVSRGDILAPGDVISTGFKSEAVIGIGKSTVVVNALTRMTVEQLFEKNNNHVSSVYVDVGSISADVNAVENKRVGFTVKTPAVTASVRGTEGNVYAYGKVESIRGTWALMPPQPKSISYDRGDAAEKEESSETETTAATTDVASAASTEASTEDAAPEAETESEANTPDVDAELDEILASTTTDKEVRVPAGEVAQVSISNPGVIQTPMQVKETNAKTIATAQTKLSVKESVGTTAPTPVVVEAPTVGDLTVIIGVKQQQSGSVNVEIDASQIRN